MTALKELANIFVTLQSLDQGSLQGPLVEDLPKTIASAEQLKKYLNIDDPLQMKGAIDSIWGNDHHRYCSYLQEAASIMNTFWLHD